MTKPLSTNDCQNDVPLYDNHHRLPAHTMSSTRRERVTEHPLKSRSNSPLVPVPDQIMTTKAAKTPPPTSNPRAEVDSASSHSSLTTTINTASLIQSAARSVLDSVYTPTSTNVSDDEDEDDENQEERKHQQRQHLPIPTLESLQKQSFPAMPDEQDRKRFVGCLAAVLASAYDYDVATEEEDPSHAAESYAYLNRTEQGHDDGEEVEGEVETGYHQSYAGVEPEISFMENDEDYYFSLVCGATSFEYSEAPDQSRRTQPKNQSASSRESHRKKSTIARNRHRKRRYDLMSKLLLSSADLLLLDKSQARAFLPLLARVLMPQSASEKANGFRIRQQQLQQKREDQQKEKADAQLKMQEELLSTDSNETPSKSTASSDAYTTPQRHIEKGINRYHFSPTTGIPVSQQISLQEHIPEDDQGGYFVPHGIDDEDHLRPFLESLSPGAGYRCLALLLLQHLLSNAEGYDARVRHVIKKLGVLVLIHDMELEQDLELVDDAAEHDVPAPPNNKRAKVKPCMKARYESLVVAATRKFEAMEHSIAVRLIRLSREQQRLQEVGKQQAAKNRNGYRRPSATQVSEAVSLTLSRQQLVRSLKIGSAGLVAGTIFAVTGGLAAPGIAAGMAAIAGSTAATAAVAALVSSTPAVTAIFGVGGGILAANKMNRRTQGLTEFEFRRQDKILSDQQRKAEDAEEVQAELFSTVCISGWLRDQHDFERPWGIQPTNPRIRDRLELLERFYAVYRPDHVSKCKNLLKKWKGEEKQLWALLKQKYGRDPDHLYPIPSSHNSVGFFQGLTLEQEEILDDLFVELGYVATADDIGRKDAEVKPAAKSSFEDLCQRLHHPQTKATVENATQSQNGRFRFPGSNNSSLLDESFQGPAPADTLSYTSSGFDSVATSQAATTTDGGKEEKKEAPKHIATVWDYHARYGGEVYTVKWESDMLIEVCDSVEDLAFDLINGATAQLLRQTALHTLLSAVAVPYALINAANMIDGSWTLAVERADAAGKELAKSLLYSRAGHRPVTLVGFSFGARAIYSCLKELAKYQEKWENSRENSRAGSGIDNSGKEEYSWAMREPASIVEDVILMGLPNHLSLGSWMACRQIVSGRFVNCYSRNDLILSLMFQMKRLHGALRPVCGTCPVNVPGVENVDVSDIVSSHEDYCLVAGEILKRVKHGQPFRAPTSFAAGAIVPAGRQLN